MNQSSVISWEVDNYAFNCYFPRNDYFNLPTSALKCRTVCRSTPHCTHYMWNVSNGGTCWLKLGPVSPDNAIPTTTPDNTICGYLPPIDWKDGNWAYYCDFEGNNLTDAQVVE
eukprot:TRINITY_DN15922_c0_g1_i4.p1 TRINITY_DN15922_c0_g1~~TRINITY_DN15922_c0_g1_i4.p1  ORF type:complete len:113 (-),score=25.57 TRINITY_DN15922_c0_g1_i4:384-722(-)